MFKPTQLQKVNNFKIRMYKFVEYFLGWMTRNENLIENI